MSSQNDEAGQKRQSCWVIAGLGNPGKKYEMTRHNMGSLVVEAFAHSQGWTFKEEKALRVKACRQKMDGVDLHLILPTTYMNESGAAVRRYLDYYKLSADQLLVAVDDIALPFGKMRLRPLGGAGGHNGLKNVQAHLGTEQFARLRIGIGRHEKGSNMADYVLDPFYPKEIEALKDVLSEGCRLIGLLCKNDLCHVMLQVNTGISEE